MLRSSGQPCCECWDEPNHRFLLAFREMPPITVQGIGVDAKADHLLVTVTLSEAPPQPWIEFFRKRATGSRLGIAGATFKHNRLCIELPRRKELETLIRVVEALVENTNFDVEFLLTPDPE